jgi:hypothetical protein
VIPVAFAALLAARAEHCLDAFELDNTTSSAVRVTLESSHTEQLTVAPHSVVRHCEAGQAYSALFEVRLADGSPFEQRHSMPIGAHADDALTIAFTIREHAGTFAIDGPKVRVEP